MPYTVKIKLDATSASVSIGDAVVAVAGGGPDDTITCKKLNGLLSPGSKWAGVAHASGTPGSLVDVQQVGLVPSTITGLSAAAPPLRSLVRVNRTTGRLERLSGTAPLEKGDLVVGVADQYGNVLLLDHDSGVYDVRDFGAVGDGVTDDAPAFAAAIAAMGGGTGGADGTVLRVPAGTYKCRDDIHVYKQCTILLFGQQRPTAAYLSTRASTLRTSTSTTPRTRGSTCVGISRGAHSAAAVERRLPNAASCSAGSGS
jgi:Pectate lyase superfamily protein